MAVVRIFCSNYFFVLSLPFPSQNDHFATERQAGDPAEQNQGVPPEIHTAVFLKFPHLSLH